MNSSPTPHRPKPGKKGSLLSVENLCVGYGEKVLLSNISFRISKGELVTLMGPNGAGKSTLVRALLGLLPLKSGTIYFHNRQGLGYVPQKLALNESFPLTVQNFLSLSSSATRMSIERVTCSFGIQNLLNQQLGSLSGGERQRVLLAHAFLKDPELLILDEPFQGIDIAGSHELIGFLEKAVKDQKKGVLLISHDLHHVMAASTYVICLNHHICCEGSPDSIQQDPHFQSLYASKNQSFLKDFSHYTHHHDHHHQGRLVALNNDAEQEEAPPS